MTSELSVDKMRKTCELRSITCESTEELEPLDTIIGQERAVKALQFGLGIQERGFNIYSAGPPGTGKTTAVKTFLEEKAKTKSVPADWCYVNNFKDPYHPKAIRLPPGLATEFRVDMRKLVESARIAIPRAFESEEYSSKREDLGKRIGASRDEQFASLDRKAREQSFMVQVSPVGLLLVPVVEGRALTEEELEALDEKAKDEIVRRRQLLEAELHSTIRQVREIEKKAADEAAKLNRDVATYALGHLIAELVEKYNAVPEVLEYLSNAQDDMIENLAQFDKAREKQQAEQFPWMRESSFRRYEVNVITDNSSLKGAPVVIEPNPTYNNLFAGLRLSLLPKRHGKNSTL